MGTNMSNRRRRRSKKQRWSIILTLLIIPILVGVINTLITDFASVILDPPKLYASGQLDGYEAPATDSDNVEFDQKSEIGDVYEENDADQAPTSLKDGYVNGKLDGPEVGYVNGEMVTLFGEYWEPLIVLFLTNETDVTISLVNMSVEVLDFKSFDEFVVRGAVGGADLLDIIYCSCYISPEIGKYAVNILGTDPNSTADISERKYVSIDQAEGGRFNVRLFPDTPGLYVCKVLVEYVSQNGNIETAASQNMKFVYDPFSEGTYL